MKLDGKVALITGGGTGRRASIRNLNTSTSVGTLMLEPIQSS